MSSQRADSALGIICDLTGIIALMFDRSVAEPHFADAPNVDTIAGPDSPRLVTRQPKIGLDIIDGFGTVTAEASPQT